MSVRALKVLLVEDSAVLAERIVDLLAEMPEIEITPALQTEAQALAMLRRRHFDVVILDLQLKEGSGFELLRAIARMKLTTRTIVLTNHDLPEYQSTAAALGATAFLDKARDFDRLPAILQDLIARQ